MTALGLKICESRAICKWQQKAEFELSGEHDHVENRGEDDILGHIFIGH